MELMLCKSCLKSPCTANTALLALIKVQGLLRHMLQTIPKKDSRGFRFHFPLFRLPANIGGELNM